MSAIQERNARECLDAIRLAIQGAGNDHAAVVIVEKILETAPPIRPKDTRSVVRLVAAIRATPAWLRVA